MKGRLVTVHLLLAEEASAAVADEVAETLRAWEHSENGTTLKDWGYAANSNPDSPATLVSIPEDYEEGELYRLLAKKEAA